MTVHDEISVAMLRDRLGDGPSVLVTPCDPPALAVYVGAERVELKVAEVCVSRVDLVCMTAELGMVFARVVTGIPAGCPCPPAGPTGWLPVATVYVPPLCCSVNAWHIAEIHP